MGWIVIILLVGEFVDLVDVKSYLCVDGDEDDFYILVFIIVVW